MRTWIHRTIGGGAGIALALAACAALGQSPAPAANVHSPAQQPTSQRTIQMVQAQASLDTTLDAKKAKQGEEVKAKLQQNVQIPNEQALPKNTVLEGHVDQVMASEQKGDSTMVITFDKARLKDGKELPIKATVLQVSEPVQMQADGAGGAAANMPAGGAAPSLSTSQMGGGGTAGGGRAQTAPSPQPMDVPAANPNPQQEHHQNGIPGVMLTSDIHQPTSATFTSKGRNVHVPDGVEMQLALTVIPAGVQIH
ncbi:MAG TPA: hypothetical protein VHX37_09995 [Acidobacteriaceae bacterium]|jgi:hypothetical protein|nr:hypothetical protein [Acidobacteriaceae bacterium]